jgi:hypothetical protein
VGFLDRLRGADHTLAAAPDPKPPATTTKLRGTTGRGHSEGFLELEETNPELMHPHGHAIYDRMYRTDGDTRQAVQLVCNPIIAGTWESQPHGGELAEKEDQEIAAALRWAMFDAMKPGFLGHLAQMLPVLARSGMAPFELPWTHGEWTPQDGKSRTLVFPRTLALRLPRTIWRFEQDEWGDLRGIWQQIPIDPVTLVRGPSNRLNNAAPGETEIFLPAQALVYYRLGAEGDNWEGQSLLRPAFKHWKMKDQVERIDVIAQEREAVGIPVAYPPRGATSDQLDELEEVLKNVRTNEQGYIVMPGPKAGEGASEDQGWLVEILGYDRRGSGRDPMPTLEYHTAKIAASFIAEFMRLGHGESGARATAQVQQDPFLQSIEAFAGIVEDVVHEQLTLPFVRFNFGEEKARTPPRLKMSLVDSTSLSQLADFVLKLAQVGALVPDQELENFLRARADLPAPNPEAVKKRGEEDDKLRREVITGGGEPGGDPSGTGAKKANGDRYGQNSKPGKAHGTKSAPARSQSGGGAGSLHDDIDDEVITLMGAAPRFRPLWDDDLEDLRHWELGVDWYGLHDAMEGASQRMWDAGQQAVYELAGELVDRSSPVGMVASQAIQPTQRLAGVLAEPMMSLYELGAQSTADEVGGMCDLYGITAKTLDAGARDRSRAGVVARATIAAEQVASAMRHAALNADLTWGEDNARARSTVERAGMAALKRVGQDHGTSAVQHGRHDHAVMLADAGVPILTARYSSRLDRSTCEHCREADDGVARSMDDPVRLDRRPPNPHCDSAHSGENLCRCVEIFEVQPPDGFDDTATLDEGTPLPDFVVEVSQVLIARGMAPARAVATARMIAKDFCRTGRLLWPGLRSRIDATRADACLVP